MKKNIDQLFNELIQLMPELKKDEDDWREFVENFVESRPNSKIDADFKKELHKEIRKKTNQMKNLKQTKSNNTGKFLLTFFGGGAVATFIIFPMINPSPQDTALKNTNRLLVQEQSEEVAADSNLINIKKNNKENAFGALNIEKESDGSNTGRGGAAAKMMADAPEAASFSSRMIMPPYYGRVNYEYVYEGDELPNIAEKIEVFKKQSESSAPSFQNQLTAMGINLIDLKTFKNLDLENISFTENSDLGYQVSINFERGDISIHKDHEKWQEELCPGKPYCDLKQIKKEDIPSNKKLISIADQFLKKHKIINAHLGTPIVKKYWEEEDQGDHIYYPDAIPVIYPFVVNGQEITSQWGDKIGVRINVNIRLNKVESANFSSLNLESSEYEALTQDALLELAKKGGSQGVQYNNPEQVIKVKLGTPQKTLTQMYIRNKDGEREEIYVPALVFPIQKSEEDKDAKSRYHHHPKSIVVPIAKNIMNQNASPDVFPIQPMPRTLEEPMILENAIEK